MSARWRESTARRPHVISGEGVTPDARCGNGADTAPAVASAWPACPEHRQRALRAILSGGGVGSGMWFLARALAWAGSERNDTSRGGDGDGDAPRDSGNIGFLVVVVGCFRCRGLSEAVVPRCLGVACRIDFEPMACG